MVLVEGLPAAQAARCNSWLRVNAYLRRVEFSTGYPAVFEVEPRLGLVDKIFIEYHSFPELPQTLHRILAALDSAGFRSCIGAMDAETNPVCHPPFSLERKRFFNIVYAERWTGRS